MRTSADAAPSLTARITAFGETQARAEENLAATKIELTSSDAGLRIGLTCRDGKEPSHGGWSSGPTANVDLELRVPAGLELDLSTHSGDVDATGPFRTAKVHSSYGSVRIEDVEGDVEAASRSGDVRVSRAKGKRLSAESNYGKVVVSDCEAESMEIRSRSGDVQIEDAKSERIETGSGYGDVEMQRVGGEIAAKLSSGDVRLEDWSGSRAKLATNYGDVRIARAKGAVEASSSSGAVEVKEFEGALEAKSSYGNLRLDGVFTALEGDTRSGDVRVQVRPGSRIERDWELSSSYGGIEFRVPDGFGCDLDAKTGYGSVDVDLPVEVRSSADKNEGGKSIRGKLQGGGKRVELRCKSGDVKVSAAG